MKFVYALSFLFAFVCAAQAKQLECELIVINPIQNLTVGKITLTLIGKTVNQDVVFEETNIKTYNELKLNTEFPEAVEAIKINWQGETENKPLLFTWLRIRADKWSFYEFKLDSATIQSGETRHFDRTIF